MIVAAVDSAELTGLAVVARYADRPDALLWRATVVVRTAADVSAAVRAIAGWSPDVVAVEEPFSHPRNPETGLVLARLLGRWLQAFETEARLGCVTVPVGLWQPATLPDFSTRMRSAERKAAAQLLARQRFDVEVGPDEADAIAIGLYTLANVRIGAAA